MWNKPWTMKEGFLVGGGLIVAGLMLELSVGPVVWDAFAWPLNGIVLAGFFVMLTTMAYLRKKVYAFIWMSTYQAAIPAMVYAVVLTIIMGLTRQQVNGTWIYNMLSFWPFVLIYLYITVILGLTIHRRLRKIFKGEGALKRDVPFMLNHLGLFIALTTATLGCADMQRVKMICGVGEPEWRVLEQGGAIKEMPIAIELKKFIMETYDNGSPKRYASEIHLRDRWMENLSVRLRHSDGRPKPDNDTGAGKRPMAALGLCGLLHDAGRRSADDPGGSVSQIENSYAQGSWVVLFLRRLRLALCIFLLR